jgi:hypothetical protein
MRDSGEERRDDAHVGPARARAPWRNAVAGVAVLAIVVAGAIAVVNLGDDGATPTRIAAPTVAVGDVDLSILSTGFDGDGARGAIDPGVVDTVRAIPGVAGAQGAMQRFVEVVRTDATYAAMPPASVRSTIAISQEDGAPLAFSAGGPPRQSGEIAIDQSLASLYGVGVGDDLLVHAGAMEFSTPLASRPDDTGAQPQTMTPRGTTEHVVGVFSPASGEVVDVNLVVMRADDLATTTHRDSFDRIDIVAGTDVPVDELMDRVAAALPDGTMVVPPSVVGFDEQLRAELEIQRAYHDILNPDVERRRNSIYGSPQDPESQAQAQRNWDQAGDQPANTELRVSRVTFVDATTAVVTYRAYYAGVPSGVVREPLTGVAERIDGQWRLSQAGLCELARAAGLDCASGDQPSTASYGTPPNGWNAADSVPGVADAFRVLAGPTSTVEQRVAVVDRGGELREAIAAGAASDTKRGGSVSFVVSGARLVDATHAQVLYSLIADGTPHLETPYPLVGNAVLVDGSWKAASRFACGLQALATLACPPAATLPTTTTTTTSTSIPTSTTGLPVTTGQPTTTTTTTTTTTPTTTTDPNSVEVPTTLATP